MQLQNFVNNLCDFLLHSCYSFFFLLLFLFEAVLLAISPLCLAGVQSLVYCLQCFFFYRLVIFIIIKKKKKKKKKKIRSILNRTTSHAQLPFSSDYHNKTFNYNLAHNVVNKTHLFVNNLA